MGVHRTCRISRSGTLFELSKELSPSTSASASTPAVPGVLEFDLAIVSVVLVLASARPFRGQVSFHLRGFSPPGWFAPREASRVCCTPLPILRFAALRVGPGPCGSGAVPSATRAPFEAFFLVRSRLHSHPRGKSLPSCRYRLLTDPGIFAPPFAWGSSRSPSTSWGACLAPADFRALSHWSSPPRSTDVATDGRALLPWVSHPARQVPL
jgi:hypothetical protein